jgi:hypothetical protein
VLRLYPGQQQKLYFSVEFQQGFNHYTISVNRLKTQWFRLVDKQINLQAGISQLSIELTPPRDAPPGDYRFEVKYGADQHSKVHQLILRIEVEPAVHVTTGLSVVKVWSLSGTRPDSRAGYFPLEVHRAANTDTPFRIAVKRPQSRTKGDNTSKNRKANSRSAAGGTMQVDDIYESLPTGGPSWRYEFDLEMEQFNTLLRTEPKPKEISLRVERRGVWWFGWKQKHQLKVAAVPVTNPQNAGQPGNTVDLTVELRFSPLLFGALHGMGAKFVYSGFLAD